jgi:ankyrin repeat protein
MKLLQEASADANRPDNKGMTPLHAAAKHNSTAAVKYLLSLKMRNSHGFDGGLLRVDLRAVDHFDR